MTNDWKKYTIVFFITAGLFLSALYTSSFFNDKKIDQLKSIQDKISIDILSSETQFSLLEDSACKDVENNTVLSQELGSLGEKIESSEANLGNSEDVIALKRYYSLLEIKDYLLMKKVSERCKQKTVFILYFYTTEENCSECTKQGYVLTALRDKYPDLRVYSFDYNLDLSAVRTLISVSKVEDTKLPAMVIDGKLVTGFRSIEDIETALPELQTLGGQVIETPAPSVKKSTTKSTSSSTTTTSATNSILEPKPETTQTSPATSTAQ